MTIRALPWILLLCALAARAEVTESETTTTFGNITTYRSGGGYERQPGTGGYNDNYNRYRDRPDGYDDQYNRPRSRRGEQTDSQLGSGKTNARKKPLDTAPSRQQRLRSRSSRQRSESSQEILQRYETPGITTPGMSTGYRSPYDPAQYRDRGSRAIRGRENPGYNQSNGGRSRQPVQPMEDGALPEGGSDDAHAITR
ncbi:MAG: hypothetical protein HY749_03770 [Gammaproteobacteria bacterium]|nr:hypothetical protein [Gammaproteobacteria bacterium]MBI5618131.1 hypothetical protein [Gammaproteobacteria bacterium]